MKTNPSKTFTHLTRGSTQKPKNSGIFSNSGAGQKMDPKDYGGKGNKKLLDYAVGPNHTMKTAK